MGNGLKHIVISLGYNASSLAAQIGNNALPQGWGYNAIQQISFRIGGSSQYFMTGQQLLRGRHLPAGPCLGMVLRDA